MAMSAPASMQGQRLIRELQVAVGRIRERGEQHLKTTLTRKGARLTGENSWNSTFSIVEQGTLSDKTLVKVELLAVRGIRIFGNKVLDVGRPTCRLIVTFSPRLAGIVREEIGAFVDVHLCDTTRFVCDPSLR